MNNTKLADELMLRNTSLVELSDAEHAEQVKIVADSYIKGHYALVKDLIFNMKRPDQEILDLVWRLLNSKSTAAQEFLMLLEKRLEAILKKDPSIVQMDESSHIKSPETPEETALIVEAKANENRLIKPALASTMPLVDHIIKNQQVLFIETLKQYSEPAQQVLLLKISGLLNEGMRDRLMDWMLFEHKLFIYNTVEL